MLVVTALLWMTYPFVRSSTDLMDSWSVLAIVCISGTWWLAVFWMLVASARTACRDPHRSFAVSLGIYWIVGLLWLVAPACLSALTLGFAARWIAGV